MKKFPLAVATIMLATATLSPYAYAASSHCEQQSYNYDSDAMATLTDYFKRINSNDWKAVLSLICDGEQQDYSDYFNDDSQVNGIKQITSLTLQHIYTVPDSMKEEQLYNIDENSSSSDSRSYIVAFDCNVSTENQYFYNGINYQLVSLTKENGSYKIYQSFRPSNRMMEKIVGSTNLSLDEKKAFDAVISCNNGLLKNAHGDIITCGFRQSM